MDSNQNITSYWPQEYTNASTASLQNCCAHRQTDRHRSCPTARWFTRNETSNNRDWLVFCLFVYGIQIKFSNPTISWSHADLHSERRQRTVTVTYSSFSVITKCKWTRSYRNSEEDEMREDWMLHVETSGRSWPPAETSDGQRPCEQVLISLHRGS